MSQGGCLPAFQAVDEPFLFWYRLEEDGGVHRAEFSRGAFLSMARKAAGLLRQHGLARESRVLHCFGANEWEDLAFRLGAWMIGAVPVTVNWQADSPERVFYKLERTGAGAVVAGPSFDGKILDDLRAKNKDLSFPDAKKLSDGGDIGFSGAPEVSAPEDDRMIIFTSGTTGMPKGVVLTDGNYAVNRETFEQMLGIREQDKFAVLVVNPLHHTNSTAICDWAIRRPGSHIHLIQRYATSYWKILTEMADSGYDRIVAPTVSRHFDFLDELAASNRLPVDQNRLKRAMAKVDFLIGSAPVGPKTIECLKTFSGKTPFVRFGSTETCLQVIGIPHEMTEKDRMDNFRRGWDYRIGGEAFPGYYIGRPHPPHTEARIVKSIDRNSNGFLKDVSPGTPGYLIVRGKNIMKEYVGNAAATREVFEDGWYLGLKDICFALSDERDGALDYFWMSRDAGMLIRGGANYACEQIGAELQDFVAEHYGLSKAAFDLAVVGIKVESEHEDACCMTLELKDDTARALRKTMEETFIDKAPGYVSKGARPDYLRFAGIPRNFKGALLVPELKRDFENHLQSLKD